MRIGIQTWGSEGDVNPFIALAGGLAKAGHKVTLAITCMERKSYARFAEQLGFSLGTVDYIGKSDEEFILVSEKLRASSNPLRQLRVVLDEMFEPGVSAMYETAQSLCAENDLIIGHFLLHPAHAAAEIAGKPYLTVTLNHGSIATPYSPPSMLPNLGGSLNMLFWKIAQGLINLIALPRINRLRDRAGLPSLRSYREVWESPICNLIAVSHIFFPTMPDFERNQKVCGFYSGSFQNSLWDIPENLERFLKSGPQPVYMSFGSMASIRKDAASTTESARLLVDAARLAGCRAIIQARWADVLDVPEDENIYRLESAPHERIFPLCAAVVHHGGAGTTQTATLCGCPSVVVAHIVDQYLWGAELKNLGVAPNVLDRRTVTAAKIARELRKVLATPAMQERAKSLGEQLRNEDGVQAAVDIIERMFVH